MFALLGGCSRYEHSWVDGLVGTSPWTSRKMLRSTHLHTKTFN
jgi:hypothetical protein